MWKTVIIAAVAMSAIACASAGNEAAPRPSGASSYAHDVVTFEELARTKDTAGNLYQALERIRPTFVRPRLSGRPTNATAASAIDVFVDGGYAGDGSVLLTLNPATIASVRMQRRSQAFVMHGSAIRGENVLYVTLLK
jgi:hypothetical protein